MENITINKLELATELAHYMLVQEWEDRSENIYVEDDNGDTRYNEDAQDIFNHYYDRFEIIIETVQEGRAITNKQ
jgi:hypothetical protein